MKGFLFISVSFFVVISLRSQPKPESGISFSDIPNRIWGTYLGGTGDEVISFIAVDQTGNIYATGGTDSDSSIATPGSHQVTPGGGTDAFLIKFNPEGDVLWGTYYGGEENDMGWCLAFDTLNYIYLVGVTKSSGQIATPGAFKPVKQGENEAYLVKFDSNGQRIWGTYFGGSDLDGGYGCSTDNQNHIYITGFTTSTDQISTTGAHQEVFAGEYDAFLVQFTPSGQRTWGTYYGGSLSDIGSSCTCSPDQIIYLAGTSQSTDNIGSPGSHQSVAGGDYDGFLVRFTEDGSRQWGTYYGGQGNDAIVSVSLDGDSNIVVTGYTGSDNNIASPGAFQGNRSGQVDAFLAKFNPDGQRFWGTYFGGEAIEEGRSCVSGSENHLMMTGSTSSLTGIATQGVFQPMNGGKDDAFLVMFSPQGEREWATYYGGSEQDQGYACLFPSGENCMLAGYSSSHENIATPGSYQPIFGGGNRDAFLVNFNVIYPHVEEYSSRDFSIFPDLSNGSFVLQGTSQKKETVYLSIHDMLGKRIGNEIVTLPGGWFQHQISVHPAPGIYLLQLVFGDSMKPVVLKFLIR